MRNIAEKTWDYDRLVELFQVLANPIRLRILQYLLSNCCRNIENGCSVGDIYTDLDMPQPYISKHLKILSDKGVLQYERQGNRILYKFSVNCSLGEVIKFLKGFGATCCS
jgi:DNA-binding transcriptional ArsR family regulator